MSAERRGIRGEKIYRLWSDNIPLPAGHPATGSKKCFLTTACVDAMGLPDDCAQLTVLRAFRDGYLAHQVDGPAMIETYYAVAPSIVSRIETDDDRAAVLAGIFEVIERCVTAIRAGEPDVALGAYRDMVLRLARRYGIPGAA